MKIAIPLWETKISPVLDSARLVRIIDVRGGETVVVDEFALPEHVAEKAAAIAAKADEVVCGALSCLMEAELAARGVRVHPWIMGDFENIVRACAEGCVSEMEYTMPGCGHHHRHGQCRKGNSTGMRRRQCREGG